MTRNQRTRRTPTTALLIFLTVGGAAAIWSLFIAQFGMVAVLVGAPVISLCWMSASAHQQKRRRTDRETLRAQIDTQRERLRRDGT